jgi:DNA-binding NtrC family response regulator/tetratricopeptide (TPR) repeat protein
MSLFHAGTGRLPFAVGSMDSLRAWWASGSPARPRDMDPAAPAVMDSLIAGLTAGAGGSGFRSAGEALDFLRSRVAPPPPARPLAGARAPAAGREAFLEDLTDRMVRGDAAGSIPLICAAPAVGKNGILEALDARLQANGVRTLLFTSTSDTRALSAAGEIAQDLSALGSSPESASPRSGDLAARLRDLDVVVLLDHESDAPRGVPLAAGPALSFLRSLAARARRSRAGRRLPALVTATTDPPGLARLLGLEEKDLEAHPVDPLSASAIREIAREYFAVESFPGDIASRIEAESGGSPALVEEALESLAQAGAAVDVLGRFKTPEALPERLVAAARPGLDPRALSPALRRALGLLVAAGEPLDPAGAGLRFPEWRAGLWRAHLDALRARGFLRREERVEGAYRLAPAASSLSAADLLGEDETAARTSLARVLDDLVRPGARPPARTLIAAASNLLALGDPMAAARLARRLREDRGAEDPLILRSIIAALEEDPARTHPGARRRSLALRLRTAPALDRAGRAEEALEILAGGGEDAPAWYASGARLAAAEVLERAGRVDEAIERIEGLARAALEPGQAAATTGPGPAAIEAAGRIAALYFRAGLASRGRECLRLGSDMLAAARSGPNGLRGARAARTLALLARAESAHGDPEIAMGLLEEALAIARSTGREDLCRGPLNELGILYGRHRKWTAALRVFAEIGAAGRSRGDLLGALKAAYNQAVIHYRLQDLDRAEDLFREARRISEELGRHDLEAAILIGFAGVLRERRRWLEALRLYRRVIRPGSGAQPRDLALAHGNIREIYLVLGRPGKSLRHANAAYRIAKGLDDNFLRRTMLRFRGIARWALGRSEDARRDLERALAMASAARDERAVGAASHYLGLLAAAGGDTKEAVRRLRAGMVSSRKADDALHVSAGKAAILSELSGLGRKRAARRILHGGGRGEWRRASLVARVLALRADPRWPANHEEVIDACAAAAREGLVWEAFLALVAALRDPDLTAPARESLSLARDASASRIVRRVPARYERDFRRLWGLPDPEAQPAPEEVATAVTAAPEEMLGSLASFLHDPAPGHGFLRKLLEDLGAFAGARSVQIIQDDSIDRRPFPLAGRPAGGLHGPPRGHEAALARARSTAAPVDSPPHVFLGLPHPGATRVLSVELAPGVRLERDALEGIVSRAAAVALAIRLVELEEDLRGERARREEASSEVHRANVIMTKEKRDLETALLTQRLEASDLRRELAARSIVPSRPRPPASASAAMQAILSRLPGIATRGIPVLLTGESGVGKDFLARWIHHLSPRRERPFVAEICDVPESLIEAELFGFVRGAFTGAVSDRPGLFERASGGTIYLDEISDLAPAVQARLLRVLEEKKVRPIGAADPVSVDFRLISSSRHAAQDLAGKGLRRDLLYRINAEVIEIPPLRERPEDIPVLIEEAIREHSRVTGLEPPYLHPDVRARLAGHAWPGNVRELLNELGRILVERPIEVTPEMLSLEDRGRKERAVAVPSLREERSRVERELLVKALELGGGNATEAARSLKVTRRYLGMLLRKHNLRLEELRDPAPSGRRPAAGGRTETPRDPQAKPGR